MQHASLKLIECLFKPDRFPNNPPKDELRYKPSGSRCLNGQVKHFY